MLNTLLVWSYLFFTTCWVRCCNYLGFIDDKAKARDVKWLAHGPQIVSHRTGFLSHEHEFFQLFRNHSISDVFIPAIVIRVYKTSESRSVVSDSLWPHWLYSPWNSPSQNTGVGSFSFSRGSSQPRDQTQVSSVEGGFFTRWATKETLMRSLQFHLHPAVTKVSFPTLVSGDNEW